MSTSRRLRRRSAPAAVYLEFLEERKLLSASLLGTRAAPTTYIPTPFAAAGVFEPLFTNESGNPNITVGLPFPSGFDPTTLRSVYGVNQISFGSVVGDGTGQTVAIVDAYHYPSAYSDLSAFNSAMGLPSLQLYTGTNSGAYFRQVAQDGSTIFPATDPAGAGNHTWEMEEALDIEWVHAIAPGANIILVETTSNANESLFAGVDWARNQPTVSVINMSFGEAEFSSETTYDPTLTTPAGHAGVTFIAGSGDEGAYQGGTAAKTPFYPASSTSVVALGGTTMSGFGSQYQLETAWSGSGGGVSTYEAKPAYQSSVNISTTRRTYPDISMTGDPNTGVAIYDSWDLGSDTPWTQLGGTSLSGPLFSGLMAITNQGRALAGLSSLDGLSQTLPALYNLPPADLHDIVTGNNGSNGNPGYSAGVGYDLVTGLGSPVANLLVPDLTGQGAVIGTTYQDSNGDGSLTSSDTTLPGVTVFIDSNGNGVFDHTKQTVTYAATGLPLGIPDNNPAGRTSTITISNPGTISDLTINFTINHPFDSDLVGTLTGPDGTTITLFSHVGSNKQFFTNTTLSTSGLTSIAVGAAPFTGTFFPSPGSLATFNGKSDVGTWKFKIVDSVAGFFGPLVSWSLGVTTGTNEISTVSDANGNYQFHLPNGSYKIAQVTPDTYIPVAPITVNAGVASRNTTYNFGSFPTVFNAGGANDSFFLTLDPNDNSKLQIYNGNSAIGSPSYSISTSALPSLTFTLQGANNLLSLDFSHGAPLGSTSLIVNGTGGTSDQLRIIGGTPTTQFTMTDTQIGLTGGAIVQYNNLSTMTLVSGTFNYSGTLRTLQNLSVNSGSTFNWT